MVITGETMTLSNSQAKGRNRTSRLRGKHEITLKKQETKKANITLEQKIKR